LKYLDPEEFRQESRRLYHQWLRMRPKAEAESVIEAEASKGTVAVEGEADSSNTFEEAKE
jgi:hypothetical protein